MKASAIASALRSMIAARQPVFVWGGPGIGKSAIVRQIAQLLGLELRDIRSSFSILWICEVCRSWVKAAAQSGPFNAFYHATAAASCFWMS